MMHVEPSFVLYALLLDPGCCLRAHIILSEIVGLVKQKKYKRQPHQGRLDIAGRCHYPREDRWDSGSGVP